jgi:hypothetical protein
MSQEDIHELRRDESSRDTKPDKPAQIVIGVNNKLSDDGCALCGARAEPHGIDLMLAHTHALVCRPCGLTHARPLAMLLGLADAAQGFAYVHEEAFFTQNSVEKGGKK